MNIQSFSVVAVFLLGGGLISNLQAFSPKPFIYKTNTNQRVSSWKQQFEPPFRNTLPFGPSGTTTAIQAMKSCYDELTSQITNTLGLQSTDFTASYGTDVWSCSKSGVSGTAQWCTEKSPKYLTGVSYITRTDPIQRENSFTINIWMGPSYDVPHMLLTFGEMSSPRDGTISYSIAADYVTRGATPIGSDPQMLDQYYGVDVSNAWIKAYSSHGAIPEGPPKEFSSRLLQSPARIAVKGLLSEEEARYIVQDHVNRFLTWVSQAPPIMARSRGSFNLRDDKLRQYFFRGEVSRNIAEFGEELGLNIGAVNTGPTAEAYVGGGS